MIIGDMWYYSKNGMQLGPLSQEELSAKVTGGEVHASDLIWREGMVDWKPLAQVPEFQGSSASVMPPPVGTGASPMPQPHAYPSGYAPGTVPNYLWQSILVTVLCCLPFGVVSIVHAAKVDSLLAQGNLVGATAASQSAKKWAIVGVASWGAIIALYFLFILVMVLIGASAPSPSGSP
ncbi:MAG: hypothetical protein RLZZ505_226 [Verrucomicrobiota bacterium]|jgi:hypothetical protein